MEDDIQSSLHRAQRLLERDGVVGVGLGEDATGRPALVVMVDAPGADVPTEFEGHPVRVDVVGEVRGGPPEEER